MTKPSGSGHHTYLSTIRDLPVSVENPEFPKKTHIFLPKAINRWQSGDDPLFSFVTSEAGAYSEVLSVLEQGWGEGGVHELRLEIWPLPERTEAGNP